MITKYLTFLILVTLCSKTYSQTLFVQSITYSRQSSGDNGYTLDGIRMSGGTRLKLLNTGNFGSNGTYPKTISIFDGYGTSGSLTSVSTLPLNTIFFFGLFNKLDASTQQFTNAEIDSLYNWSLRGGKVIITSGASLSTILVSNILNSKWGYSYHQAQSGSSFIPTAIGNNTAIFKGPFGNVIVANQGGAAQGYFSSLPSNSKIFATDANGNATLFMDCNTLDLIIADVDGYTDMGGITPGSMITNSQDKFWGNTLVFMDRLQPIPVITNISNTLTLNSSYTSYQWYLNNTPINGAVNQDYTIVKNGNYYVTVTLNGGCSKKSNTLIIDTLIDTPIESHNLVMPNVFTPNHDGINDTFKPITFKGMKAGHLVILNRWGKIVYETNDLKIGWNGQINGHSASDGVYFWKIEYQDAKGTKYSKSGFLQLL